MMVKKSGKSHRRPSKSTALAGVSEKTAEIAKAALRDEAVHRLHGLEKTLRDVALAPVAGHSAAMLKTIADFAQAQMVWAARQRLGQDVEDHGFGIKTEAMAELGRVLEELPKRTTSHSRGGGSKLKPGLSVIAAQLDVVQGLVAECLEACG